MNELKHYLQPNQLPFHNQPSLSPQSHRKFDLLTELQAEFTKTHKFYQLSPSAKIISKKIFGSGVKAVAEGKNDNLLALGYVFLVLSYRESDVDILKPALINELNSLEDNYKKIENYPNKKIITQNRIFSLTKYILSSLNQHKPDYGIFQILDKLYSPLEIMVLYFRALLSKLKYPGAEDYDCKLNTDEIYAILSEYFDLNCQSNAKTYFFNDYGLFISIVDEEEVIFGRYYENETAYIQSQKVIKKSTIEYIQDINEKANKLKISGDLTQSISGFIFHEDVPYFSSNIPTPEFGEDGLPIQEQKKQSKPLLQKSEEMQLRLGSFGNHKLQLRSQIVEDDDENDKQKLNESNQSHRREEKIQNQLQKSLKGISYKQCDSERDDQVKQSPTSPQKVTPEGLISPISEDVVHYIGASRYLNDFLSSQMNGEPESPQKLQQKSALLKSLTQKLMKTNLSKSCFHDLKLDSEKITKLQQVLSPQSLFSCTCTEVKQSKMKFSPNVVNVAYIPSSPKIDLNQNKKKLFESYQYSPTYQKLKLNKNVINEKKQKKQETLITYRSEERINGFPKGKMPKFLKNRQKNGFKSNDAKSNKSRSISMSKKIFPKIQQKNLAFTSNNIKSSPNLYFSKETLSSKIFQKQLFNGGYSQKYVPPYLAHNQWEKRDGVGYLGSSHFRKL